MAGDFQDRRARGSGRRAAPVEGRARSQRQLRVGEELRHALSEIFLREGFRDPDLESVNLTVTEVRSSPDLRNATVFVSPLGGGEAARILAGLKRAAPYLRSEVARRVHLKYLPRFDFKLDESFDEAARIDAALEDRRVKRDLAGAAESADSDEPV